MIELIKKAMFTGIGVASLTKEKVETVAKEFVDKAGLSEDEGKKFVKDILVKSAESKEDVRKQIEEIVNSTLEKMNLAKDTDVQELKNEIAKLRAEIENAE